MVVLTSQLTKFWSLLLNRSPVTVNEGLTWQLGELLYALQRVVATLSKTLHPARFRAAMADGFLNGILFHMLSDQNDFPLSSVL